MTTEDEPDRFFSDIQRLGFEVSHLQGQGELLLSHSEGGCEAKFKLTNPNCCEACKEIALAIRDITSKHRHKREA